MSPPRLIHSVLGQVIVLPLAALILFLASYDFERYRSLLQEDQWAEWATFLSFLIAGVLFFVTARRSKEQLTKWFIIALGAFCIFVAGEEISWGHRLFAFQPPEIFLEKNYQQESNLHNLLKEVLDTRWIVLAIALGYAGFAGLRFTKWRELAPSPMLVPGLLCVAGLEFVYPYTLSGELAELILGLTFLLDAGLRWRPQNGVRAALIFQVASLIGASMLTAWVDRVLYGGSEEVALQVQKELSLLSKDLQQPGVLSRRLRRKRRVHKRLYTANKKGYFELGAGSAFLEGKLSPAESEDARRDRRGYFLDTWNQPYWMIYLKGKDGQRILGVYSFGPNRRRESKLKDGAMFGGDDIGVQFSLP